MTNLSHKTGKIFLLFSAAALLLASCTESAAPTFLGTPVRIVEPKTVVDLEDTFYRYSYDISQLNAGVPPLIFGSLPTEMSEVRSSSRKKSLFFQTLLPMVLLANKEISEERSDLLKLTKIIANNQELEEEQLHRLSTLQLRYSVTGDPTAMKTLSKLQSRIDQVPAGLALAQAANESAWGTSRFSQLGNNLFGEWTFTPGTGIIPEGRPEGEIYEVRRFDTLYDSIRSYLRNLNTHSAYADFRKIRTEIRERGESPSGVALAEGLTNYSTRREAYIIDLQNLIRQNNLQRFTQVRLRQG
jgi:Bax protein